MHTRLEKGLASRDLDERQPVGPNLLEDLLDALPRPLVEGELRIAPDAAQGAAGQPDEDTRQARIGGFPLQGGVDLVDLQMRRDRFLTSGLDDSSDAHPRFLSRAPGSFRLVAAARKAPRGAEADAVRASEPALTLLPGSSLSFLGTRFVTGSPARRLSARRFLMSSA